MPADQERSRDEARHPLGLLGFCTWLPASGYEAADRPCAEVYLNSPDDTVPEDLLTEPRMPVRKA